MSMQPWNVLNAPLVKWRLPREQPEEHPFKHVKTCITEVCSDGCARGFTMCAGDLEGNPVFMAFDWVELRPGVPILTDPNAVLTNLCIINEMDQRECKLKEIAHVNVMVHRLEWQKSAVAAVRLHLRDSLPQAIQRSTRQNRASALVETDSPLLRKAA